MSKSATQKYVWAVVSLIIGAIILADGMMLNLQRETALHEATEALVLFTDAATTRLDSWLETIDNRVASCGAQYRALAPPPATPAWHNWAHNFVTECAAPLQGVHGVVLYDANGHFVATSSARGPIIADMAGQDFFTSLRSRSGNGPQISPPLATGESDTAFFMAQSLQDQNGRFAGALATQHSIRELADYYKNILPRGYQLFLTRSDGLTLIFVPQSPARHTKSAKPESLLSVMRPIKSAPLSLKLALSEDIVLQNYNDRRPRMLEYGALCILAVIILMRFLARHFARIESDRKILQETQNQFQAVLSNIPQGICFYSGNNELIICNQRYLEMFALDSNQVKPGMQLTDVIALARQGGVQLKDNADMVVNGRFRANLQEGDHTATLELQDGRTLALGYRVMPGGGWVATHEDITDRRNAEARIIYLARHDPLTGLVNREVLREFIDKALPQAERGHKCAVLFLDLDRFKAVNDTLGHAAGDELLKAVADRLRATVRTSDTIARLGGDEFVVLQPGVDLPNGAMRLAERIIEALSAPYLLAGQEARIGVSVGIALAPADGKTGEALLKNADLALYLAKSEGRGTFRFFEPEMDARLVRRHDMERGLRAAIAKSQLELHYQPIITLPAHRVVAFEALLRWNHPNSGILLPASFLTIAEEANIMAGIGDWVMEQACLQAQSWPDDIILTVNVALAQLRQPEFAQNIAATLRKAGMPPARLQLEVSEKTFLAASRSCTEALRAAQKIGVRVALDGFGAGQVSLLLLKEFAFDQIKFDPAFIKDLGESYETLAILRTVLRLIGELGCKATIVGVENQLQREALQDCEATQLQGFLFSPPLTAQALPEWLAYAQRPQNFPTLPPDALTQRQVSAPLGP